MFRCFLHLSHIFAVMYNHAHLVHSILLHCIWHIDHKVLNKLKHALNGNMFVKGKGRGKGKQTIDPEAEYQGAVRAPYQVPRASG